MIRDFKDLFIVGAYPVSEKSWLDVGQWESYQKTARGFIWQR